MPENILVDLYSDNWEKRIAAIKVACESRDHDVLPDLVEFLRNDPQIRSAVASFLQEFGDSASSLAGPALVELLDAESGDDRLSALETITAFKYSIPAETAYALLLNDTDEFVRMAAADYLAEVRFPDALDPLMQSAALDSVPLVRSTALETLALIGNRDLLEPLSRLLNTEAESIVRGEIFVAMYRFGRRENLADFLDLLRSESDSDYRSYLVGILMDLTARATPEYFVYDADAALSELLQLAARHPYFRDPAKRLRRWILDRL